jgi:hypothetical protein
MAQINVDFSALTIRQGPSERASITTQRMAFIIYVNQNIVEAMCSEHLAGRVTGYAFCRFVPVGNSSVAVHGVDAIEKLIQEPFVYRCNVVCA